MYSFWFFSNTDHQPTHIYTGGSFDAGFEECSERYGLVWYSAAMDSLLRGEQVQIEGDYTGTIVAVQKG